MNRVFSNLFWKFGERISSQLVSFIVSIVLARLLSPTEYGTISLILIFITIAEVFVTSGFGSALIQKLDADNIDFSSVFYVNIVFSCFLYLIIFFVSPYIARFYNSPILSPTLRVLGIRIPIAAINSIQQAYVSKKMMFRKFFISTLFGTISSGLIGISMAYLGFGVWALVGQYLVNTIVNTIVLWFTVKWRPERVFSWSKVSSLISYGWKLLFSSLLDTGYNQLRSLVIGIKYSSDDLAYYNRGLQYPQLLVTNINSSISSVLFPAISEQQEHLDVVKNLTRRAIKTSSYIMWPLMIGLAVVAKPLVQLMLTEKWLPCVPYLQISCIAYAFWPIHTANLESLKAIGRSDVFLRLEIVKKCLGIFLLLLSMNYGVMAIAISMFISNTVSSFINAYPNRNLLKYSFVDQLKDMAPGLLLSILMGILIYPLSLFIFNPFILLLMQIFIGALFYILISRLLKIESFMYILKFFRKGEK